MISSSGPVNIPVEDKSYKWSKKILKAAGNGFSVTIITALIKDLH
jgi:hypothetical protein